MNITTAKKIILENQHSYSAIARDFNRTRRSLWPSSLHLARYVNDGDAVLDVGCGNGRMTQLFEGKHIHYTGVDNNSELIAFAQENYPKYLFQQGDMLDLPFGDETFDVIFCIAVLHHIPGKALRLQALGEARRVLKKDGILVMTNWNRYALKYAKPLAHYTLLKLFGKSKLDFRDIYVPWANTATRYYHCFTLGELKKVVRKAGFSILKAYKTKRHPPKERDSNLVIIAKK